MTLLVQVQPVLGVVGVWRVYRDQLEFYYAPNVSARLQEQARDTLHRGTDQKWAEVFEYAIQRSPYGSQYFLVDVGDDEDDLEYLFSKVQRLYARGKMPIVTSYADSSE